MSSINIQRWWWSGQNQVNVSAVSSMLLDHQVEGLTTVRTQLIGQSYQVTTGSGTKMLFWGRCRDWNTAKSLQWKYAGVSQTTKVVEACVTEELPTSEGKSVSMHVHKQTRPSSVRLHSMMILELPSCQAMCHRSDDVALLGPVTPTYNI